MQGVTSPQAPGSPTRGRGGTPAAPPAKLKHSFWWYIKWFFIIVQIVVFCVIVTTVSVGWALYNRMNEIVPDLRLMEARNKAESTKVFASDGSLLAEFKGEQRKWVPIEELKVTKLRNGQKVRDFGHLINATISIEDSRFYTHPGMDPKRIVGAAYANFKHRDSTKQGGSTITEQLAVNVYLTRTKTVARRLQTALLALQLERKLTKDEILQLYLNEIYYGNGASGCEAAAFRYFNRSAKKLTLAQAALLAGLPQQPGRLDPFEHFKRAMARQRLVLREMFENKKINWGQYQAALKDNSIAPSIRQAKERFADERQEVTKWRYPYFVAYTKQYLQKTYDWSDEFLNKSGLKIYTTLDPKIQESAERRMQYNLKLRSYGDAPLQGALVCIDPWTGHVVAMYGGRDFYNKKSGQFNRATQAKLQPGSSFKPYVYAAAMEQGYSPDSMVRDSKLRLKNGREVRRGGREVRNYTHKHEGLITMRRAIAQSNNVVATKVLLKLGIPTVIEKAHLMGIESRLPPYPSLALGAGLVTVLEHTSAFGVFATRGLRAEPSPVERVDNGKDETLIEHTHPVAAARVLSADAGNRMWDMLRYVVTNGTGSEAALSNAEAIGKTGTTTDNKAIWFMGASKDLVCGVWMGYDKQKDLGGNSAGGKWCAPVWRSFMTDALQVWGKRDRVKRLVEDARATQRQRMLAGQYKQVLSRRICKESSLLANAACPVVQTIEFANPSGAPTATCDIHQPESRSRDRLDDGDTGGSSSADLGYEAIPETGSDTSVDSGDTARSDDGRNDGNDYDSTVPRPDTDYGEAQPPARRTTGSRAGGRTTRSSSDPPEPERVEDESAVTICADSGMVANSRCPVTMQEYYTASTRPSRRCNMH